jgi:hypothetical protein
VKKKKISAIPVVLIIAFILLELFCSYWYLHFDGIEVLEYFLNLGIFFIMLYDNSNKNIRVCLDMFFVGVLVFSMVVVISGLISAPSNWIELFAKGWFRFGESSVTSGTMALRGNANELAYYCITGLTVGLLTLNYKKGMTKIITLIAMVIIGYGGVLSLSRSFVIVFLVLLILFFFSRIKSPKAFFLVIVTFAVTTYLSMLYLKNNPELLEGFLSRFSDSTISSGGGRFTGLARQWDSFLNIPRCWLIGTGVTQYIDILGGTASIHNMLSQVIICYGIPAGIIFLVAIISPILSKSNCNRKRMDLWLPLIAVILFVQTIQFLNPYSLMFPYVIGVYASKTA